MILLRALFGVVAMFCAMMAPACAFAQAAGVLHEQADVAVDTPCHGDERAPADDVPLHCVVLCGVFLAPVAAEVTAAFDGLEFDWARETFAVFEREPPAPPPRAFLL